LCRFASTAAKRHNLRDVLPGDEARFVAPLGVERLPSVGLELGRRLAEMGVATAGALALVPPEVLEGAFGPAGRRLAAEARGIDPSPVVPGARRACLEESETFEPDLLRWDALEARLDLLCARLGAVLRQRGWSTRRLVLELEHSDRVRVRRQATQRATNIDGALFTAGREALAAAYTRRVRVRRLALQAWGLETASVQLDLFAPDAEVRLQRLALAADRVRERYGDGRALVRGRALQAVPAPERRRAQPAGGRVAAPQRRR
jgi:DNA polymerase-4